MSDSDRGGSDKALNDGLGVATAILLSCLIVGFLAYSEGYRREAGQNRTYEYEQAAKNNAIIACRNLEPAAIADCVYDEVGSAREKSQGEQDLDAQQSMARWAAVLTIISALTTLISWVALKYLRDTFGKTAEMAEQTEKMALASIEATNAMVRQNELAEEAQRPWLKIDEVRIEHLEFEEYPDRVDIKDIFSAAIEVEVRNLGKAVANEVQILPYMWLSGPEENSNFEMWEKHWLCALEEAERRRSKIGRIIFPAEMDIFRHRINTSAFPLNGTMEVDRNCPHIVRLFITVVVLYRGAGSSRHYSVANVVTSLEIGTWVTRGQVPGYQITYHRLAGGDLIA